MNQTGLELIETQLSVLQSAGIKVFTSTPVPLSLKESLAHADLKLISCVSAS